MKETTHTRGVKRLRFRGTLILIAALLFFAISHVPVTYGAELTLRFATLQAPTNERAIRFVKVLDAITEKTKGSLKFQVHYGKESGFKQKEYIYAMKKGLLDGGICGLASNSFEYPMLDIMGPFFVLGDAKLREPAINALKPKLKDFLVEQGVVPLAYYVYVDPSVIYSKNRVDSLSDFKGMLIRIYNPSSIALVKMLGGTPTSIQKSETYMALQKGTVGGAITDAAAAKDMNFAEVCKNMTIIQANTNTNLIGMSKKAWDKLSTDQQKVVVKEFAKFETDTWKLTNDPVYSARSTNYAKSKGMRVTELPDDVKAIIPKIRENQIQIYLKKSGKRGKELLAIVDSVIAKHGK